MKKILLLFSLCQILLSVACGQSIAINSTNKDIAKEKQVDKQIENELIYKVKKSNQANAKTLILMHGLGSDENNLFSMAKAIPNNWNVFSLRAPLTHTNGRYSWYELNLENGAKDRNLQDIENSMQKILAFIDYASTKYNIDTENVFLGGFSQGSIMSLRMALLYPQKISGAVCFSGLLLEDTPAKITNKKALKDLQIFMSHGRNDRVIAFDETIDAKKILEEADAKLSFFEYDSGHTISQENFSDFINWLNTVN